MAPALLTVILETDTFLADRAVTAVIRSARADDPTTERRDVAASEAGAADALSEALSPSLFGEAAVVVLDGLTASDVGLLDVLCRGVADPADGVHVVALYPTGSKSKKTMDRLKAAAESGAKLVGRPLAFDVVAAANIKGRNGFIDFATQEFRSLHRRVTRDGLEALVTAVGQDTRMLASSVAQLAADSDADPIDADAVNATFGGVADMPGYEIADAVWSRNKLLALQRLQWAAESAPNNVGPSVVGALAASLRSLIRVRAMGHAPDADVAREAGVPPFRVRALRERARKWTPDELGAAAIGLARMDASVKGGLSDRNQAMDPAQKIHALQAWVIATIDG